MDMQVLQFLLWAARRADADDDAQSACVLQGERSTTAKLSADDEFLLRRAFDLGHCAISLDVAPEVDGRGPHAGDGVREPAGWRWSMAPGADA